MLGVNYGPECDPLAALKDDDKGVISVYAQRRDYHDVIKKKLKALARWLVAETQAEVKVFVDTAPVMEKPLAMRAGLGWQGKHTNLVSRQFGSWLFLGSVFTTLELSPDAPEDDHCGACTACLDICPTNAFPAPYQLDARRCISYLTIEHDGMIDRDLRPLMGNHIYGCDDCLAVCPWNKFAQSGQEIKLAMKADYDRPDLIELSRLDDAAFRQFFAGTPVKRSGRDNFIRNVLIALGNMAQPQAAHIEAVEARLDDVSDVVRASAVWALAQMDIEAGKTLAEKMRGDDSALVQTRSGGTGGRMSKHILFFGFGYCAQFWHRFWPRKAGTCLRPAAMKTKRRACKGWASPRSCWMARRYRPQHWTGSAILFYRPRRAMMAIRPCRFCDRPWKKMASNFNGSAISRPPAFMATMRAHGLMKIRRGAAWRTRPKTGPRPKRLGEAGRDA